MNNLKHMHLQKLINLGTATSTLLGSKVFECTDSACGLPGEAA